MANCCVWDFTLSKDNFTEKELIGTLGTFCKKWCFQLEKGESDYEHYQGRFSLMEKKRLTGVKKMFAAYEKMHFSPTSTENRDNTFYVTKEDTRIAGPWMNNKETVCIPRDVAAIIELRPWQATICEMAKTYEQRVVDIIYDPIGAIGKTVLTRYMMVNGLCSILPFVNDFKDMMRMAMCIGSKPCYIIDMPRAINKEKLYQLYSGIEMLKSGYSYDDRYEFRQSLFDPPRIIVFTNVLPDMGMLSADRWRIWEVINNCLTEFAGAAL